MYAQAKLHTQVLRHVARQSAAVLRKRWYFCNISNAVHGAPIAPLAIRQHSEPQRELCGSLCMGCCLTSNYQGHKTTWNTLRWVHVSSLVCEVGMDSALSAVGAGRKRVDGSLIRLALLAGMDAKARATVESAVKELEAGATKLR